MKDVCPNCGLKNMMIVTFDGYQTYVHCGHGECSFDALVGDGDLRERMKQELAGQEGAGK